jgi:hypothetical protein
MLTPRATFVRGLLAGMALVLAVQALHWLGTPEAHPFVSSSRRTLMGLQAIAGILVAIWMTRGIDGRDGASRD